MPLEPCRRVDGCLGPTLKAEHKGPLHHCVIKLQEYARDRSLAPLARDEAAALDQGVQSRSSQHAQLGVRIDEGQALRRQGLRASKGHQNRISFLGNGQGQLGALDALKGAVLERRPVASEPATIGPTMPRRRGSGQKVGRLRERATRKLLTGE